MALLWDIIGMPLRIIYAYPCELFLVVMLIAIIMIVRYTSMGNTNKQKYKHKKNNSYYALQIVDPFTQKKEGFSPQYEKELGLFKSMNFDEQQQYLNLSREQKLAKYGSEIM